MAIILTSKLFYDEFTGTGVTGCNYANYNVGDKATCKVNFYVKRSFEAKNMVFVAANKTITNNNALDFTSFITDGEFMVGDTIAITGTASNNITITIAAITDRVITTVGAITSETATSCNFYANVAVTQLRFLYNLVNPSANQSFESLTDRGTTQKFLGTGLDASNVAAVNLAIDTDSFGWNTNTLVSAALGTTSEVTIAGVAISADYKYQFTLTHTFIVTPAIKADLFDSLINSKVPTAFPLDYIIDFTDPYTGASALKSKPRWTLVVWNGGNLICWFNQNNVGSRPDVYLGTPTYTDVVLATSTTSIDINRTTQVDINVVSRGAKFVAGDKVIVNMLWGSVNEVDYVKTSTTWKQNMFYDRKLVTEGAGAVNGENTGTGYQVLQTITAVRTDASNMAIRFTSDLGSTIKTALKLRDASNLYFLIWITYQPASVVIPTQSVRVAASVFKLGIYDKTNPNLVALLGTGIQAYQHPDEVSNPMGSIYGSVGDPFYTRTQFSVQWDKAGYANPPKVNYVSAQVVAIKSGYDDYILEEKKMDVSQSQILAGIVQLSVTDTRGFTTYTDDPYNRVKLFRVPSLDSGTLAAYELQYGLILRYDYWRSIFSVQDGTTPDIYNDLSTLVNLWSNYNNVVSWNLYFRVVISVTGYDGFENVYNAKIPIIAYNSAANPDPAHAVAPSCTMQFFMEDSVGTLTETNSIVPLSDGKTRIRATYSGVDFSVFYNSYDTWDGILFSDVLNSGSVFTRRFASSEIASESGSPFSAPSQMAGASSSRANGNVRINFVGTTNVVIEGYFDPTIYGTNQVLIYSRLKAYISEKLLLLSDSTPILLATDEGITSNT